MIAFFKNIINAIRRLFGAKEEQKEVDVPQGLQVWDENGDVQLDTSTSTSTIVKIIEITEANKPVTYTNSIFNEDNFFYLISPCGRWTNYYITVTLDGSTVTIVSTSNLAINITVVLGVF